MTDRSYEVAPVAAGFEVMRRDPLPANLKLDGLPY